MSSRIDDLLSRMTPDEKVDLVTGMDMWHTRPIPRLEIGSMKVTDGPNGARGDGLLGTGTPTACVPSGSALGATWDPALLERIGALLGDEARAKGAHVLLAPTINLHRSPKGGRNFECYSEDPVLSGQLAAGFVRGVQSRGVATTPKHFAANDSEYERNTISSEVDERTLREVYLVPFEYAIKRGGAWGVMSAYNQLNGRFCSEHEWLLGKVLREDWGFDGFVVSDWFALRSTAASANAGLSLEMPGQGKWYGPKLAAALKEGEVDDVALDRITRDVLRVLERTGVLDATPGAGQEPNQEQEEKALDRREDRALIREAAAAGTVLLRNDGTLPLDPAALSTVAVIGPNAYEAQIMGGGSAKVAAYRATSPLAALEERIGSDTEIRYARGCDIHRSTPPLGRPLLDGMATLDFRAGHVQDGEVIASISVSSFEFMKFGAPAPGVPRDAFCFEMRGTLVPRVSGVHELRLIQLGRTRVLMDGELVLDASEAEYERGDAFFGFGSVEIVQQVELVAGVPVDITLEYSNRDAVFLTAVKLGVVSLVEEDLIGEAEALAAQSDVAIVVVGTNDDWETEGRDRDLFELPGDQPELIRRVSKANERTIVVVNAGAPHALDWLDAPAATLQTGFAGQELGDALVDVLLGETEPSGRMPTSVPARYEQFAAWVSYPGENGVVRYGEGVFVGHRWYDAIGVAPAVPFGHGLSYTTFRISAPRAVSSIAAGESLTLEVDVENTGSRPGSEVLQVYVEPLDPRLTRPLRELKGFAKLSLAAGEVRTATIELEPRAFAYYDVADEEFARLAAGLPVPSEDGHLRREVAGWYVDPGEYRIVVGRSSADLLHSQTITIEGESRRLPS